MSKIYLHSISLDSELYSEIKQGTKYNLVESFFNQVDSEEAFIEPEDYDTVADYGFKVLDDRLTFYSMYSEVYRQINDSISAIENVTTYVLTASKITTDEDSSLFRMTPTYIHTLLTNEGTTLDIKAFDSIVELSNFLNDKSYNMITNGKSLQQVFRNVSIYNVLKNYNIEEDVR